MKWDKRYRKGDMVAVVMFLIAAIVIFGNGRYSPFWLLALPLGRFVVAPWFDQRALKARKP
jgi:hypothetical protein